MNIDWSKAPFDAEAGIEGRGGFYAAWYRRDGNGAVQQICPGAGITEWTWMGGRRDFPYGHVMRPAAVQTTADLIDRGYLEPLPLYQQSCGRIYRLPPVGSTVRIDKGDRIIWDAAEMFIGVDVTLVATFKTGDTQMVAVEHPVEKQCCCFRADMVQTLEQIEAERRKDTISKMLRYAAITGESFRSVCGKMYDAGLRFEVKP